MAVRWPIPPISGTGIRNPNSARLGMVCPTLANHSAHRRPAGCRASIAAAGNPERGRHDDRDRDQLQMFQRERQNLRKHRRLHDSSRPARNARASVVCALRNSSGVASTSIAPSFSERYARPQHQRLAHIVRHEQRRLARRPPQFEKLPLQVEARNRIERAERFIE